MQSLIYLIRHAEVDKASPRRFLGRTDLPLNRNGILQAQALHGQLRHIPFSRVCTSSLQRAVQTAALVSGRQPESLLLIEEFNEINLGDWEGLSVAEVESRFPGAYEQRGRDMEHFRPHKGESFRDLADRCYPALIRLAGTDPGPLLIIAHAGVNRVLLCRLQDRPLQQVMEIPQDYCGVTILRCSPERWTVEAVNLRGLPLVHALQLKPCE